MHMTLRARMLDLLPIMLVIAIVSSFAVFAFVQFVLHDPVQVPASTITTDASAPR